MSLCLGFSLSVIAQSVLIDCQNSRTKFEAAKVVHNNSYVFTIGKATTKYASSYKIKITVKDGEIVKRGYKGYKERYSKMMNFWEEEGTSLGQHNGFDLLTLDEVYEKVQRLVNPNQKSADSYDFVVETNENGILSKAGKNRKDCRSNCFQGYEILYFEWL